MDQMLQPFTDGLFKMFLSWWPLWAMFGIYALVSIVIVIIKRRKIARSGIHEIDQMKGITFEYYLETLFRRFGYTVERTPASGDYGADLIISKGSNRVAIQAKRYSKNVGVKAVQEIVTAMKMYHCSGAMVITNSYYTQQARKLAAVNDVTLWDRTRLIRVMLMLQKNPHAIEPHIFTSEIQKR